MDDKRALLEQLSLDRSEPAGSGRQPIMLLAGAVLLAAALGAGGAWLMLRDSADGAARTGGATVDSLSAGDSAVTEASSSDAVLDSGQAQSDGVTDNREQVLNASGYVVARRRATVSAEITGRITEILVEEGMLVEKGQVLARLDDELARSDVRLAEAQLAAARASLLSGRANLAEASRVLARTEALAAEQYSSEAAFTRAQADVEMASAEVARAEADVAVAEAQADRARERLEDHVIRAPFAGVITDKNAQPGEIVSPASAGGGFTRTGICTLVDMDSLEIEIDVNEAYIGRVSQGQPVQARLDAYPDWTIPARVVAIIPTANRDKATVQVRIGFDQLDPRILPEMGANVAFLNE